MKVLVTGANGNIGSRIVPALLTHGHAVIAYARSPSKVRDALPAPIMASITIVQGSFNGPAELAHALLEHECDAVINCAGKAAVMPWSQSDFAKIFANVVSAVRDAQSVRAQQAESTNTAARPIRMWLLGGMGALDYPTAKEDSSTPPVLISSYMHVLLEHDVNLKLLKTIPTNEIAWSFICPSYMEPRIPTAEMTLPSTKGTRPLVASATFPPAWRHSALDQIPFFGVLINFLRNAMRYTVKLEDLAEFMVADLDEGFNSKWVGKKVGVIDAEYA